VTPAALEHALADLPRHGTLVKDRGYRQIWRFAVGAKAYYLKFYPRHGTRDAWRRRFRGSPALAEFRRLQLLQKKNVPAPRPVAVLLSNFKVGDRAGDAVILEAIEPSAPLDKYLLDFHLAGRPVPDRRQLAKQLVQLVHQLGRAGLGHSDLHLGNFLLGTDDHRLHLLDGYAVRETGLLRNDVLLLGHSAAPFASTPEILRGWDALGDGGPPPRANPVSRRLWQSFLKRVTSDDRYFGQLDALAGGFRGHFVKQWALPRRWAPASRLVVARKDWERAWPALWKQVDGDQLQVLKRSRSGDVLAGEVVLGGKPVQVIVKRPRRRYWYRYLNEVGRGSRPRRAWFKAWRAVLRDLPTAWPLLLVERRKLGYVTDALIVFERVPGPTLADFDLARLAPDDRELLFRRTGKILRRIDAMGWAHFDAKASNWIAFNPDSPGDAGPQPVLIDIDGIRRRRWTALGIRRLLRSMREHRQYTPADSLALCRGYAPFSATVRPEE